MRKVFLLCVPPLILLTAWIGFILTRRSLSPIREIIASAERIERGDLSQRIPDSPAQDELGKLTVTLNQMIASLEEAFHREQRFASDASHELRTPVAVIRAYAENLLAQPELNEEARLSVQTILDECCKMQKLIEQMLTLTRAQEGRMVLHREHLCVADTLECVQMALSDAAEEKEMHISAEAPEDLMIWADQSLFTQLFVNLTENAIKYGKKGGHIRLQAMPEEKYVCLMVSDDGEGIAPEHLSHIFERFYRADSARDRSGSGLGLSIVQWIVQIHGGTISVESEVGKGTRFIIHWISDP